MAKLRTFKFKTVHGEERTLRLMADESPQLGRHTTVLTGKNGSYKSSILREIVVAATEHAHGSVHESALELLPYKPSGYKGLHVVACAGTAMDRYPSKELGGRPTTFAVPNYIYLGQRVGSNIVSRKQSLETAIACSLDETVRERYKWDFFERAFELVGTLPVLMATFQARPSSRKRAPEHRTLLERMQAAKDGDDKNTRSAKGQQVSAAMARYLLEEFDQEIFYELDRHLSERNHGRLELILKENPKSQVDLQVIRLGLLSDELSLTEAKVISRRRTDTTFSVFEKSRRTIFAAKGKFLNFTVNHEGEDKHIFHHLFNASHSNVIRTRAV